MLRFILPWGAKLYILALPPPPPSLDTYLSSGCGSYGSIPDCVNPKVQKFINQGLVIIIL